MGAEDEEQEPVLGEEEVMMLEAENINLPEVGL